MADSPLDRFRRDYPFDLDGFQVHACRSLEAGNSVLVAAPTGSGKTVVGEFAIHLAVGGGGKCFYTAPIKALSNQKFSELVARYGHDRVGLLTGDNTINGEAPIVVMTTEVLRNMLYAGSSTLAGLQYVVLDVVHYLADRFRGAVWEEVLIHLPGHVAVAALSATVSNVEEFGQWLATVRGDCDVVVEERRPVPLWQHVMAGNRLYDLFIDDEQHRVNPELVRIARNEEYEAKQHGRRPGRGGRRPRSRLTPMRVDVVSRLDRAGLLPAITFIFSRAGCDMAVQQCLAAGLRLTTPREADRIRTRVDAVADALPAEDLAVLGFGQWRQALERGVAAHHAGMLPTFKETVEELFQQGLLKAVFATETLALGINMPAKSVVLERLTKWNGEQHVALSAGEYTQLTGRAGRRGIDVEGHAVVVWTPEVDPQSLAGLASTRTYPLNSSFRPSYNMAVNLVAQVGRPRARALLETSFAQFQADRGVVGLSAEIKRYEEAMAGYAEAMTCHLGDFAEYARIRRDLTRVEKEQSRAAAAQRRSEAVAAIAVLQRGDVIMVPARRRSGPALVLDPGSDDHQGEHRPRVLMLDRKVHRLTVADFPHPPHAVGRLRIPRRFQEGSATDRRHLAERLAELAHSLPHDPRPRPAHSGQAEHIEDLRHALRRHPCHACEQREDHARWAERYDRLAARADGLRERIEGRTNTVSRLFDRVCDVLAELGYLEGADDAVQVGPSGALLAGLYNENDLVAAECLRRGIWSDLDAAELAAVCAALVFESRGRDGEGVAVRLPGGRVPQALDAMSALVEELMDCERRHRLSFITAMDLGFCRPVHRWAQGAGLDQVLWESDMTPGDFVRWCKQVLDLLGQIQQVARPSPLADQAGAAMDAISRGVVAYSSVS